MAHQLSLSPPQPGATGGKPRPLVLAAGVRGAMGAAPVRTRLAAAERPLRRAFCLWEVTRAPNQPEPEPEPVPEPEPEPEPEP